MSGIPAQVFKESKQDLCYHIFNSSKAFKRENIRVTFGERGFGRADKILKCVSQDACDWWPTDVEYFHRQEFSSIYSEFYDLNFLLGSLPAEVVQIILSFIVGSRNLKSAFVCDEVFNFNLQYRRFRNFPPLLQAWDIFLSHSANKPFRVFLLSVLPSNHGNIDPKDHEDDYTCSLGDVFYCFVEKDSLFPPTPSVGFLDGLENELDVFWNEGRVFIFENFFSRFKCLYACSFILSVSYYTVGKYGTIYMFEKGTYHRMDGDVNGIVKRDFVEFPSFDEVVSQRNRRHNEKFTVFMLDPMTKSFEEFIRRKQIFCSAFKKINV